MWLVDGKDREVALFKRDGDLPVLYQGEVDDSKYGAVCDSFRPLWRSARAF